MVRVRRAERDRIISMSRIMLLPGDDTVNPIPEAVVGMLCGVLMAIQVVYNLFPVDEFGIHAAYSRQCTLTS